MNGKHTLFGKITGETIHNLTSFNDLSMSENLGEEEKPLSPPSILLLEVLNNPFPDIIPRITTAEKLDKREKL